MAKRKKLLGWTQKPSPKDRGFKDEGWFSELDEVYVSNDKQYTVMCRTFSSMMGRVTHMCMRNRGTKETKWEGTDIPWAEKQRIKNEIFGEEMVAVEVFPKMSELVDGANMYHLWVLHDFKLPFDLR